MRNLSSDVACTYCIHKHMSKQHNIDITQRKEMDRSLARPSAYQPLKPTKSWAGGNSRVQTQYQLKIGRSCANWSNQQCMWMAWCREAIAYLFTIRQGTTKPLRTKERTMERFLRGFVLKNSNIVSEGQKIWLTHRERAREMEVRQNNF